jgi:molybdopterin-biosynthesis enzyme MoeA-like protein
MHLSIREFFKKSRMSESNRRMAEAPPSAAAPAALL